MGKGPHRVVPGWLCLKYNTHRPRVRYAISGCLLLEAFASMLGRFIDSFIHCLTESNEFSKLACNSVTVWIIIARFWCRLMYLIHNMPIYLPAKLQNNQSMVTKDFYDTNVLKLWDRFSPLLWFYKLHNRTNITSIIFS